jgi:hypothetical protein
MGMYQVITGLLTKIGIQTGVYRPEKFIALPHQREGMVLTLKSCRYDHAKGNLRNQR